MENNGVDQMAELRRQNEEMQQALREANEARAALQTQVDAVPQNAQQYMLPEMRLPKSAIVLPRLAARNFEIKPKFLSLIKASAFEGRPTECPIRHIQFFNDLCDTISSEDVPQEYIQLKAFKWSVIGKAQQWLESLPPRSITTWSQLHDMFMNKFFPPAKTTELRGLITSYRQLQG